MSYQVFEKIIQNLVDKKKMRSIIRIPLETSATANLKGAEKSYFEARQATSLWLAKKTFFNNL